MKLLPVQLAIAGFCRLSIGLSVEIDMTIAEARALSGEEIAALRELGAADLLLEKIRLESEKPDGGPVLRIDFEAQTVTHVVGGVG